MPLTVQGRLPASAAIYAAQGAKQLQPAYTVKPFWYWLLGLGAVGLMLLAQFFYKLFLRCKKRQASQPMADADYKAMLDSFSSNQRPGDMPFQNKGYLALPEPEMVDAARLMRRRMEGEAPYMHIPKTISKAMQVFFSRYSAAARSNANTWY
jgi:hypothetical protein